MSELEPVASDHDWQWHTERMASFTASKRAVGEPSPHMAIVVHLTKDQPLAERLWRGGAYLNAYSVGTAEKLWEAWPYDAARRDPEGLTRWITEHWAGFHTRTERRMVRTPAKFIRAQQGIAEWVAYCERDLIPLSRKADPRAVYEAWWETAERIPFFGRYINIRLLEYVNRITDLPLDLQDIRAIGGWSPIRALSLFRPEAWPALRTGKAGAVNRIATDVLTDLRAIGETSYYTFAAMLCEYREAYEDRHQYPGRTHDQELEYASSAKFAHWPAPPKAIWEARSALFPAEALGERSGWTGLRHDLSRVLRDHGYIWSDLEYDYGATTDLAAPARRTHGDSDARRGDRSEPRALPAGQLPVLALRAEDGDAPPLRHHGRVQPVE